MFLFWKRVEGFENNWDILLKGMWFGFAILLPNKETSSINS